MHAEDFIYLTGDPKVIIHPSTLLPVMMGADALALLMGWRRFDNLAHLAGALFGEPSPVYTGSPLVHASCSLRCYTYYLILARESSDADMRATHNCLLVIAGLFCDLLYACHTSTSKTWMLSCSAACRHNICTAYESPVSPI